MPLTAVPSGAAQDLNAPAASGTQGCSGCYIVADVAGIVWYSEVFINTAATAVVGIMTGNGSRATTTQVTQNQAQFTFHPNSQANGADIVETQIRFSPTITVGGAKLYAIPFPSLCCYHTKTA